MTNVVRESWKVVVVFVTYKWWSNLRLAQARQKERRGVWGLVGLGIALSAVSLSFRNNELTYVN